MTLKVQTNTMAQRAAKALADSDRLVGSSTQRLSTGMRINRAADDAAGLAIATKFSANLNGLSVALGNTSDAVNLLNTADGSLREISSMFQRMRELAVYAANDTLSDEDRVSLDKEFDAIRDEISRVKQATTWNGISLLDGTFQADIQVGGDANQTRSISLIDISMPEISGPLVISGSGTLTATPVFTQNYTTLVEIDTTPFVSGGTIGITIVLGNGTSSSSYDLYRNTVTYGGPQNRPINSLANAYDVAPGSTSKLSYNFLPSTTDKYYLGIEGNWFSPAGSTNTFTYTITVDGVSSITQAADISDSTNAVRSIEALDASLRSVDELRIRVGSHLNVFSSVINNILQSRLNLGESRSRVMDANYAAETATLSKNMIISNAASSMLAQANQLPRIVLDLLQTLSEP